MKIIYIHGAGATGESFNYIRDHLCHVDEMVINYNSKDGFDYNLRYMKSLLAGMDDIIFIGHSLGGIYALFLAQHFKNNTLGAITMSTPYGGSRIADWAKYFLPFSQILKDIGPHSLPIRMSNNIEITHPWYNLVSMGGDSPWMLEHNDGVVTYDSMTHRNDMELLEVFTNHYEVVISPKTVSIIQEKIKEIQQKRQLS